MCIFASVELLSADVNITQPSEIALYQAVFEERARARRGGAPLVLKAIQGLPATQTDTLSSGI